MVIGNGLIASVFDTYKDNSDYIIFASGVANSKSAIQSDYDREVNLFKQTIKQYGEKILIYFSTTSIYDPFLKDHKYVQHKLYMEQLVQKECKKYFIFRLSNVVGRTSNNNLVINYFSYHIRKQIKFQLWDITYRNIIDIDHAYNMIDFLINKKLILNQCIDICNPYFYTAREIVNSIESFIGRDGIYDIIKIDKTMIYDTGFSHELAHKLCIDFDKSKYMKNLLEKYYRM